MHPSAAVWPPHTGLIGAAGSRNRGPLPPVCPPPGHHSRNPAFPSPCYPCIPPGVRTLTPLPTSLDHHYPLNQLTNVLPNRLMLS
jgi:hypothetical protein